MPAGHTVDTLKNLVQRLLLLLLVTGAVWFCLANPSMIGRALQLPGSDLLFILCGYLACQLLNAALVAGMLRRRGRVVPLGRLLAVNAYAELRGHLALQDSGGHAGKGQIYRQGCQVPLTPGMGVLAYLGLVLIVTMSACGIVAGLWGPPQGEQPIPPLYWFVLGSSLILGLSIVLGTHKLGGVGKLSRPLQIWVANLYAVISGTTFPEVLQAMLLQLLGLLPQVLIFTTLFNGFGQDVTLYYLLFVAIFASLSLVVNLTPANLGLRELVILLMIAHLDISVAAVVALLIVDRLLQLVLLLVLGYFGYRALRPATVTSPATAG